MNTSDQPVDVPPDCPTCDGYLVPDHYCQAQAAYTDHYCQAQAAYTDRYQRMLAAYTRARATGASAVEAYRVAVAAVEAIR